MTVAFRPVLPMVHLFSLRAHGPPLSLFSLSLCCFWAAHRTIKPQHRSRSRSRSSSTAKLQRLRSATHHHDKTSTFTAPRERYTNINYIAIGKRGVAKGQKCKQPLGVVDRRRALIDSLRRRRESGQRGAGDCHVCAPLLLVFTGRDQRWQKKKGTVLV